MAEPGIDLTGLHFVRTKRGPLDSRWHVYAWRGKGAPCIMTVDQILKPALTQEALAKLVDVRRSPAEKPRGDLFLALTHAYLGSREYRTLADVTKRDYRKWIERAQTEFGAAKVVWFNDPRTRIKITKWRDNWGHSPRQAKYAMQVLSLVFDWGVERGWLALNPVKAIRSKYSVDRADIVWTDEEIDAVAAHMQPHIARAFRLSAWTGLARGDLVSLRWSEVGDNWIAKKRNKTHVEAVIPLFDQTRELLAEFKAASHGRKVASLFVVTNKWGKQFKPTGYATAVHRAHKAAGVAQGKTLHDLRGTFATRLMAAGLSNDDIDEIMGWESGNSSRTRRSYISRSAVVMSAIEQFQKRNSSKAERPA